MELVQTIAANAQAALLVATAILAAFGAVAAAAALAASRKASQTR